MMVAQTVLTVHRPTAMEGIPLELQRCLAVKTGFLAAASLWWFCIPSRWKQLVVLY